MPTLSVVIPTLNAARHLPGCLAALAGQDIWVVDGGSTDATRIVAASLGARVIAAPRGRGTQLAAGADACRGDWLLFLHADTTLAEGWREEAEHFIANPANLERAAAFRFALADPSAAARRLERIVDWRCRKLGLPYGDQGLLLSRTHYDGLGGYRPFPIMEDVDLVRRIGRRRLVLLQTPAVTSAERWSSSGWLRRSARNLVCLSLYRVGVPPRLIVRVYGR